jgi:hypothetical protein
MKKATIITTALISFILAGVSASGASSLISAVGLVHLDESNPDSFYTYLAAYPVFNYADHGVFVHDPLYADGAAVDAGTQAPAARMWTVGGPDENAVHAVSTAYNIPAGKVNAVTGDVCTVAATLAGNWTSARKVVVAPYVPGDGEQARTSGAYAAALAASLNAPLLFTYTGRTPTETVSALRRLGTVEVYVVDLDGSCSSDVLSKLGEGRQEPRVFGTAADVNAFINTCVRLEARALAPTSI